MRALKNIVLYTTLASFLWMPVGAYAGLNPFGSLDSMLSNAQVQSPGVLNSPGHTSLYGGSLNIHVPADTVQFVSISPPSFAAGCGGISMYFGGFSFISGAAFGKLIQAIMQAAPGYVINLAIRTLCPECSDILTELQKLAQAANGMGDNACHIAKQLVNGAASLMGINTNPTPPQPSDESDEAKAAKTGAGTGAFSGFFSGLNSYAGDAANAIKTLASDIQNPSQLFGSGGTKDQAAEKLAGYVGNYNWAALTLAGYSNTYVKEIILALTGDSVAGKGKTSEMDPKFTPSTTTAEKVVKLVEYGPDPTACGTYLDSQESASIVGPNGTDLASYDYQAGLASIGAIETQVGGLNEFKNVKIPTCFYYPNGGSTPSLTPESTPDTSGSGALNDCNTYYLANPSQLSDSSTGVIAANGYGYNPYIKGDNSFSGATGSEVDSCGILASVAISLSHAVQRVADGVPMTTNEMAYVQMAPFPLYQLINDASVYPSQATQLVQTYAPLLSYLISRDIVMNWISAANTITQGGQKDINPEMQKNMLNAVKKLYSDVNKADKKLATGMVVQQGIMAQIDEMNQMIAGQAAMAGMAGNMMFTQALSADMT